MKKIGKVLYDKLYFQGLEAKDLGMEKLSSDIFSTIGSLPEEYDSEYSYKDLKADIKTDLWKVSTSVLNYYDLKSIDAKRFDEMLETLASKVLEEIENGIDISDVSFGPKEPKVPGQY